MTRIIELDIDDKEVNNELLTYFQQNYKILSTHLYDFINFVSANSEYFINYIRVRGGELRSSNNNYFSIARYNEYLMQFYIIIEIFMNYAKYRGFMNDNQITYYENMFKSSVFDVLCVNCEDLLESDYVTLFLNALSGAINANNVQIYNTNEIAQMDNPYYIYWVEEYVYIKPQSAFVILLEYCKKFKKKISLTSPNDLARLLKLKKILCEYNEGKKIRYTHKLPAGRKIEERFWKIHIEKLGLVNDNN